MNTYTLIVKFCNTISYKDIPKFRGAIIKSLGPSNDILYHNHIGDGFRYSYPLIQYKRIDNKAAIVCIKDGIESIGDFFLNSSFNLNIGNSNILMEVDSVNSNKTIIQVSDTFYNYKIEKWLPLNSINYKEYLLLESIIDKTQFLEKILIGNLLSLAKGIGVTLDNEIYVHLINISSPFMIKNKNIKFMAFDIEFKCNLSIPEYIGIGKNASIGFGIITELKK